MSSSVHIRSADRCRLCFRAGYFHISIFTSENIVDAIQNIFHCTISRVDSLPNHICVDCWMTLCAFYTFYKAVQSNQTRFLDHDALDIKIENNFDEAYSYYEEFLKTIDADGQLTPDDIVHKGDSNACHEIFIKELDETDESDNLNQTENGGFSDYGLDYASDAEDSLLQIPNLLTEVTVSKKKRGRPSKSVETTHEPLKRGRGRPRKVQNIIEAISSENDSDSDSASQNSDEDFVLENRVTQYNDDDSDEATGNTRPRRGRPQKRQKMINTSEDSDSSSDDDYVLKTKKIKTEKRGRGRPKIIRTPSEEARMKKRKIGQFKCPHCVKFFTRSSRVAAHIKTRHGFKCDVCEERLSSEHRLKEHMSVHEDGFEARIRLKLEQILAIDCNDIDPDTKAAIIAKFDMKCDNCDTVFESLAEAQSHYIVKHEITRGYIKCCDIKLREEQVLKEHIAYHLDPEAYQCFVCGITLKMKSQLRIHLKNHVTGLLENRTYKCDICNKHFKSNHTLRFHVAEIHAEEKIKCEICSKTFLDERQRDKHMRNTHDKMSTEMIEFVNTVFDMNCELCETVFVSFQDARKHYLTEHNEPRGFLRCCGVKLKSLVTIAEHIDMHINPDRMKCHICNKIFKVKDHLKTHIRRHGKSFTCEICGKSFKRARTLVDHTKNRHNKVPKPFRCRFCSLRFKEEESLNKHEQLIHFGNIENARNVCDICGKGFHQTGHLNKHIQAHHSTESSKKDVKEDKSELCTICGLWLSSRYRLKLHRKSHNLSDVNRCNDCGVEAPNHEALLGHIRAFHVIRRRHKCRLCDEAFQSAEDLHAHSLTHESEKLYRCEYCAETFVWKATFDAHLKKNHSQMQST